METERGSMDYKSIVQDANIFVTGGAGSLGRALARKRKQEGWEGKFTVYSTDEHKHAFMRKLFPDVNFIQGDIRNPDTLYNSMIGHDIVIHAAAVKVIPASEYASIDTFDVNVNGSLNVCIQAQRAGIKHVLGISTDKACYPVNAYGATKMIMEKNFQEFSRVPSDTQYHLVRYGNVLESTGSVVEAWRRAVQNGEEVLITEPSMTRFWISPSIAAMYAIFALGLQSGHIYVPAMKSLSIGKMLQYIVGDYSKIGRIPLRPGEKIHETLVTVEESYRSLYAFKQYYEIHPSTENLFPHPGIDGKPYTSDAAEELTKEELMDLLNE